MNKTKTIPLTVERSKQAFELRKAGMKYSEIAQVLGRLDNVSIPVTGQRARQLVAKQVYRMVRRREMTSTEAQKVMKGLWFLPGH